MDVFLIPIGREEYELYYEPPEAADGADGADGAGAASEGGLFSRWRRQFAEMLREAEQERHRAPAAEPPGLLARARRRMMRFIIERVSEWRLLWHLRTANLVTAHVPADISMEEADRIIKSILKGDADRHVRWVAIDLLLLAATAPLMFVPGPNVLAYYFTFNVVGHFLAMRGARRGLTTVEWRHLSTPALSELRVALGLADPHRFRTVLDIAARLRLQHLARFFERLAVPTA
jgi:hypothetical protein